MIYELHRNLDHITEEGVYDAKIIYYTNWQNAPRLHPSYDDDAYGLPNPVEYTGNLETLAWLDYPYTVPTSSLLMSKRMVDVLLSVRSFPHYTYPVRIYSDQIADVVRNSVGERSKRKITDPKLYTDRFVILKLSSYTDCLDPDATIVDDVPFSQTGEEAVDPIGVQHYEFIESLEDFPPVFITPEIYIYVWSEEAKTACEQAGLQGLDFWPVP